MYLKIFSCFGITKGKARATLIDLQRRQIFFIPLSLYNLIDQKNFSLNLEEIKSNLDGDSISIFNEYVEFLLDNEIGFLCEKNELELYPKLSNRWDYPSIISNCIIDIDQDGSFFNFDIITQLEELCCYHLEIRFFSVNDQVKLEEYLKIIKNSSIKTVQILLQSSVNLLDEGYLISILENNPKIKNIIVSGGPYDKHLEGHNFSGRAYISTSEILSNIHCGIVQLEQFSLNIKHYTESLNYNSCLNRKISINRIGDIKNCPSLPDSYGNIKNTLLSEAIEKPGFKKYWNVTKDTINKCKDCEFRHICTDCRAFTENPGDIHAAPLKCGYNPATCIWEEWSSNDVKQKIFDNYKLRGFN